MIAGPFAANTAQVDAAAALIQTAYGPSTAQEVAKRERGQKLWFALNAADRAYDDLGPHLKIALTYEGRVVFRQPKRVRAELEIAARKLAVLTKQVETAMANLEG